jgi:hypothetical protein
MNMVSTQEKSLVIDGAELIALMLIMIEIVIHYSAFIASILPFNEVVILVVILLGISVLVRRIKAYARS